MLLYLQHQWVFALRHPFCSLQPPMKIFWLLCCTQKFSNFLKWMYLTFAKSFFPPLSLSVSLKQPHHDSFRCCCLCSSRHLGCPPQWSKTFKLDLRFEIWFCFFDFSTRWSSSCWGEMGISEDLFFCCYCLDLV